MPGYQQDLAYIHDAGFRDYALNAAPGLLSILARNKIRGGLVVDLGCGSGRWALKLNCAGYQVLGIDQSRSMIRLAREIAPASKFRVGSLLSVELPACRAVTSIGECLNYRFDNRNSRAQLMRLFRRVYRALEPGGVFIFDIAEPSRLPAKTPQQRWLEGPDWAVLVSVDGDRRRHLLDRRIVCYRKLGNLYRRSEELHQLRLYRAADLMQELANMGFQVRGLDWYGRFRLPPAIRGILARKLT